MSHFKQTDIAQPLKGLKIADIGCGGGLLSEVRTSPLHTDSDKMNQRTEFQCLFPSCSTSLLSLLLVTSINQPLARLGGSVTGIDAAPENVGVADAHRRLDPILCQPGRLQYRAITAGVCCGW